MWANAICGSFEEKRGEQKQLQKNSRSATTANEKYCFLLFCFVECGGCSFHGVFCAVARFLLFDFQFIVELSTFCHLFIIVVYSVSVCVRASATNTQHLFFFLYCCCQLPLSFFLSFISCGGISTAISFSEYTIFFDDVQFAGYVGFCCCWFLILLFFFIILHISSYHLFLESIFSPFSPSFVYSFLYVYDFVFFLLVVPYWQSFVFSCVAYFFWWIHKKMTWELRIEKKPHALAIKIRRL